MTRPDRILIVDDDPLMVDLLEQELEELGYETVSAANGQEALHKVADEPPDLILLDIMMPIMDGFEACRILQENEETRLIPIVIMTALNAIEDRVKGIEAGAEDFLTKPVDDRELLARIRMLLERKRDVDTIRLKLRHYSNFVPGVVKRIIKENPDAPELGKREQDAAVLFADICEFTRLSKILTPDDLNSLVERYFSAYLNRIQEFGGDISETSGDGLMAIFHGRDPWSHARMAADTAIALFRETDALNMEGGGPPLSLHMGISCGISSVGSTRFKGLQGSRWVFTADGFMPNLAARLAGIAGAGQILIGPETGRRLENRYPLKRIGHKQLKNIDEPVDIYCLLLPFTQT